ncbi:MAG: hypothetical protein RIR62_1950 [Pseudomonadota bacterium]|jgi:DNA-binding Xre family transcriptional regulator
MTDAIEKGQPGQSFDDFLREQGTYEETTEQAVTRVVAYQLAEAMKAQGITKTQLAQSLGTSRSQIDRLLDPTREGVSLGTLARAARAVGRKLRLELV